MIDVYDGTAVLLYDARLAPMKPVGNARNVACAICGAAAGFSCVEKKRDYEHRFIERPPHLERARTARWVEMMHL